MITTYSFENLSDKTYVSDDQLSSITFFSTANDEAETESKHDLFLTDEYTNRNNFNDSKTEFIPHQLFDINNHNLNEDCKKN